MEDNRETKDDDFHVIMSFSHIRALHVFNGSYQS